MVWNEQGSKKRVQGNDFHDFEVDVQDLRRAMDFRNLGTKDVRRAAAVHLYVDVPNFHRAVDDAGNDKQKQRKLVRLASVLRKVQGDLLTEDEIGDIQRQTVRAHALAYKPYDSDDESHEADRVKKAVVHAITHNTFVLDVFNSVFKDVRNFSSAVGLASGTSYIANIGKHGDRELISLGSCTILPPKCWAAGTPSRSRRPCTTSSRIVSKTTSRRPAKSLGFRFIKRPACDGAATPNWPRNLG